SRGDRGSRSGPDRYRTTASAPVRVSPSTSTSTSTSTRYTPSRSRNACHSAAAVDAHTMPREAMAAMRQPSFMGRWARYSRVRRGVELVALPPQTGLAGVAIGALDTVLGIGDALSDLGLAITELDLTIGQLALTIAQP